MMGKRPRIRQTDLPNQERSSILAQLDEAFDVYVQMADQLRRAKNKSAQAEAQRALEVCDYKCRRLMHELQLVDFILKTKTEKMFNDYQSRHNIYHAQKLKSVLAQELQTEEIKKITHLIHAVRNDEDRKKLQEYIDNKSPRELNGLIQMAVAGYQKMRSDDARHKVNTFLMYFHKKIECKPYTKATSDAVKATRADFNGFFVIPSASSLERCNPYSKAYQRFCAGKGKFGQKCSPEEYNLQESPAWKACLETVMLPSMEQKLRLAMAKQGIPSQMVKELNVVDLGRILFNSYGKEKYNPKRGNRLFFEEVNPKLDSRHKIFFWKNNALPTQESCEKFRKSLLKKGVSKEYIDILIPSILNDGCPNPKVDRRKFKGVIPYFTLHHKWAIQYLGGKANNQKNYVGIAEFKSPEDFSDATPQHDIWHIADAIIRKAHGTLANGDQLYENVIGREGTADDFIEYLVDTRYDNQNDGKYWTVSMGYKPEDNIRGEIQDFIVAEKKCEHTLSKKGQKSDKRFGSNSGRK